jgi:hypothetical protein
MQRVADTTLWPRLFAGCHTGRDTAGAISSAGFELTELRRFDVPPGGPLGPAAPHITGRAVRITGFDLG